LGTTDLGTIELATTDLATVNLTTVEPEPLLLFLDTNVLLDMVEDSPSQPFNFPRLIAMAREIPSHFGVHSQDSRLSVLMLLADTVLRELDSLKDRSPRLKPLIMDLQHEKRGLIPKAIDAGILEVLTPAQGENWLRFFDQDSPLADFSRNSRNDRTIINIALLYQRSGSGRTAVLISNDEGCRFDSENHELPALSLKELNAAMAAALSGPDVVLTSELLRQHLPLKQRRPSSLSSLSMLPKISGELSEASNILKQLVDAFRAATPAATQDANEELLLLATQKARFWDQLLGRMVGPSSAHTSERSD
jgi:hypothetical protein